MKKKTIIRSSLRTNVKQSKRKRFSAFTLAETLLTLVIVGIVSTMTIPAVMHHIEKVSLHTAFLKAYSTAEQAHKIMMQNNGGTVAGADFSYISYVMNGKLATNAFDAQNKCRPGAPRTHCWHDKFFLPTGGTSTDYWGGFTTKDGMLWADGYGVNPNCTSTVKCFNLFVDVNGFKKPNVMGRDIFVIEFFADRILPQGAPGTAYGGQLCAKSSTRGNMGWTCAYYELTNKPKVGYLSGY